MSDPNTVENTDEMNLDDLMEGAEPTGTDATEGETPAGVEPNARAVEGTKKAKIRQMLTDGKTRGQIASELGVTYQTVYSVTKDLVPPKAAATNEDGTPVVRTGGGGGRIFVNINPAGEYVDAPVAGGSTIARGDFIRKLYSEGKKRGEIAKILGVSFQIVFQATKTPGNTAVAVPVKTLTEQRDELVAVMAANELKLKELDDAIAQEQLDAENAPAEPEDPNVESVDNEAPNQELQGQIDHLEG